MASQLGFGFLGGDPGTQEALRTAHGPTAPRRSAPAHRDHGVLQLPLRLEQDGERGQPTIRGQVRLEEVLRRFLGPKLLVQLTDNRSTMISFSRRNAVLYVRVHAIFADAPLVVLAALAAFLREGASAKDATLLDQWIEAHREDIRRAEAELAVQPRGEVHDLLASYERLNQQFFGGRIAAAITWSKSARNRRRTSIRMGSYCDEQRLIRIHPALDQEFVPLYFVESVVFHEMLHAEHGVVEGEDGRRCIHTPGFLEDERRFPDFDAARRWERKHLTKLLRY